MRFCMKVGLIVVCTMLSLTAAGPVLAEDRKPSSISEAQAIRIARGYGMVRVHEVERDDGGWEVEGRDHRGRRLEVTINREGRVTEVKRRSSDG
jgi:hypothetical protein